MAPKSAHAQTSRRCASHSAVLAEAVVILVESGEPALTSRALADRWRAKDPAEFSFLHRVVDEFEVHVDTDQCRARLDLLLAGPRQHGVSR